MTKYNIYKFNEDDARRFAKEQGIEVRKHGKQLQFRKCPYCQGSGKYGFDKETFAINLETGQFNCFRASCGVKGNMLTLASDFGFSLGNAADEYYQPRKRYRDISNYPRPIPTDPAIDWLETRGISADVTKKYSITTYKDSDNVIAMPFYDENGKLIMVKYRKTNFVGNGSKEWCMKNSKPILFGMDQCNPDNPTLILTEGQIDSLSVTEAGIENAVSVPTGAKGFTWIPYCWNFLCKFKKLIVFGDLENGKISLLEEMSKRFPGMTFHVRREDYKGHKDANEILLEEGKQAIIDAINNAIPVENPRIKRLSDIQRRNLNGLEIIRTGIPTLDRTIGGFYPGSLVILTGERGNGKSTLASQFGAYAIEQQKEVFFYSGELMGWLVQEWLDRQCAGTDHIRKLQSNLGYVSYLVSDDCLEQIHAWYHDFAFIYDNGILEENEELETLPDTLEKAITQYGCKMIVVDNLMTAINDDITSDLYRQQTAFTKKLSVIAKRYDAVIVLVAHPRKANGREFKNDDVAGSSNITNLADIVIRYDKPAEDKTDINPPDRILQVSKNRMSGKTHEGIRLYFDDSSKRISEKRDFGWKFGFETSDFYDADMDEIPF